MDPVVTDWDDDKIANFGKLPLKFHHNAHLSPLFDDETLARLIEHAPRENYYVNTVDISPDGSRRRREGEFAGLSGADVLDAVRQGRIWILLLYPEKIDDGYGRLLTDIYADITGHVPGLKVLKKKISILISSPRIPVFYHCDLAGQTLWQVRGQKTVYVYPNHEPYLAQPNLERIVLGEAHEISLPYKPEWDEVADVFTIEPGDMLHWQLNAPHRIDNGPSMNVSFTTEHVTPEVRRNFAVNYGNGIIRRMTGAERLSRQTSGVNYWSRLATMAAARALRLQRGREQTFKVDFKVSPGAPNGFETIPAHEFRK